MGLRGCGLLPGVARWRGLPRVVLAGVIAGGLVAACPFAGRCAGLFVG